MTPQQFVDKWKPVQLSERAAAQSHFQDLCRLFDHPDPIAADPRGEWFTFEKGVPKSGGGDGFADVWKRSHFAWEYKKKRKNLDDALGQLARYALALENPPLHIVCDTDRFRIVTAWTNSVPRSYDLGLVDLLDSTKRGWLESAFYKPERLRPGGLRADLTKAAADKFSTIATNLRARGNAPEDVAHFVNRLAFLFFAEDVKLLPDGYFRRVLREVASQPHISKEMFDALFAVLHKGGRFGVDRLPHVNGGLFDDRPALELDDSDLRLLVAAGSEDWAHIDPSIFGTLFERFLDPDKRAQIGAHYTDAEKIMRIINPVIVRPLNEEWQVAKSEIEKLTEKARARGARAKEWQKAEEQRSLFLERLRTLSVLDPACGSGNFLYLALHAVKDLEHKANQECETLGLPPRMPVVGPEILKGIEINPLAAELARTAIWIGDIQWADRNGFRTRPEPILRRLDAIECRDALLNKDATEASWPNAEFIVGNPPFLGDKLLAGRLGSEYAKNLRKAYHGRVSGNCDLVMYWFEKSRTAVETNSSKNFGLVATNSIRQKANRKILEYIQTSQCIFDAWSDEPWVNDGAAVNVSLVCVSKNKASKVMLNGTAVNEIYCDLTSGESCASSDFTSARRLASNVGHSFFGLCLAGDFTVAGSQARKWLLEPNPNRKPNSDVLSPIRSGIDVTGRARDRWVIDFGPNMLESDAQMYEAPYEHISNSVKSLRAKNNEVVRAHYWWRHGRSRPALRERLKDKQYYICTAERSKHRFFVREPVEVAPEHRLVVFPFESFCMLGILSSEFHVAWARRMGSTLEDRPGYNTQVCFDTYPFPDDLDPSAIDRNVADDPRYNDIASAAEILHQLRNEWLNPAEYVTLAPEVLNRYPHRVEAKDAHAAILLKKRTLTNLYNKPPAWLLAAHSNLNRAVARAYGWPEDIATDDALVRLLSLNFKRASGGSPPLPVPLPHPRDEMWEGGAHGLGAS